MPDKKDIEKIVKNLEEKLQKEIITTFETDKDFFVFNKKYNDKELLFYALVSLLKNEKQIIRWKSAWLMRFIASPSYFEAIVSFLESRLMIEDDDLVRYVIGSSIRDLIAKCQDFSSHDCLKKYSEIHHRATMQTRDIEIKGNIAVGKIDDNTLAYSFLVAEADYLEELIQGLTHKFYFVREKSAILLAQCRDSKALKPLASAFADTKNEYFKFEIVFSLLQLDPTPAKWLSIIQEMKNNLELREEEIKRYEDYLQNMNVQSLIESHKIREYSLLDIEKLNKEYQQVISCIDNDKKGELLEEFCESFFNEGDGFNVIRNKKLDHQEIDLIIINDVPTTYWRSLSSPNILVECKNQKKLLGQKELVWLKEKIKMQSSCRVGFYIALNGFHDNCKETMRQAQREDIIIGQITKNDFDYFFDSKLTILEFLQIAIANSIT